MKHACLAALAAATFILAVPSIASATITSTLGSSATATGTMTMRAGIISTSCAVSGTGTVTTTTAFNLRSVAFSGCGVGMTIAVLGLPWTVSIALSPRTFNLSGIQIERTIPVYGRCLYSGSMAGTYAAGASTTLTITSTSLVLVSGSALCSRAPIFNGVLRTNVATV